MKLVLFDFDGVIVPSFRAAYRTMRETVDPSLSEEQFRDAFNGGRTSPIYWKATGGETSRVEETTPFFKAYGPRLAATEPVPGMGECIHAVVAKGVSIAIVSSTMDRLIEQFLQQHGLSDAFQRIYGASVGKDKRVKLCQTLVDFEVDVSEAVFVTDTLGDIEDATAVGLCSVAVTWGYQPRETLERGTPWKVVEQPEVLRAVLEEGL